MKPEELLLLSTYLKSLNENQEWVQIEDNKPRLKGFYFQI